MLSCIPGNLWRPLPGHAGLRTPRTLVEADRKWCLQTGRRFCRAHLECVSPEVASGPPPRSPLHDLGSAVGGMAEAGAPGRAREEPLLTCRVCSRSSESCVACKDGRSRQVRGDGWLRAAAGGGALVRGLWGSVAGLHTGRRPDEAFLAPPAITKWREWEASPAHRCVGKPPLLAAGGRIRP